MPKHISKPSVTRFDVILAFILSFAVAIIVADAWLVVNGFEQLSPSVWTFAGTLTGGEIVAFSLYQIAKEITGSKATKQKVLASKHAYIGQLQEEEEQDGREQGTDKP